MRYFVANGYRPSPYVPRESDHGNGLVSFGQAEGTTRRQMVLRYREAGVDLPPLGEQVLLAIPRSGRLAVFVHEAYEAFLLVTARSQRQAYLLATAFRAAATCFLGQPPGSNYDAYLLELHSAPTPDMKREDIARSLGHPQDTRRRSDIGLLMAIGSGTLLNHVQIRDACSIAREALKRPAILDALLHLEYSRTLFWGFMVGSFYECHYSRDRRGITRYELERTYLENRFRYDSAFVSAFRGIECVLGRPHFKKAEVPRLLTKADCLYGTSFASQRHRSWHEVFSSKRKWWQYSDLIAYYLRLRNTVSAHGNPSPPLIVMQDQVFEIQYLLQSMVGEILIPGGVEGLADSRWRPPKGRI